MQKERKLKPAHKKFVAEYVKSNNGTQAALKAYPSQTKKSASVTSTKLLKKVSIQKAIDDALNKVGATPEFAVQVLAEVAEQDKEVGARRLAAKDILELHGWRKDERPQTTLSINNAFFQGIVDSNKQVSDTEPIDV